MDLDKYNMKILKERKKKSELEANKLLSRINMLQNEDRKSTVQLQNILRKTQSIELQKVQVLQYQEKYRQMLATTKYNLNEKKQEININKFNNQQRLLDSLNHLQSINQGKYDHIKSKQQQNHQELNKMQSISDLSKKIKHDNVIYSENQAKQTINDYWIKKMQRSKQFHDQKKLEYIKEAGINRLKIKSLEKLETQYLQKLELSQTQQNLAANRLEKLYILPKEEYFNQFEKIYKIENAGKNVKLEQGWNQYWNSEKSEFKQDNLNKLEPYRQPLPLLNGSKFISVNSSINKLINFPDNSIVSGFDSGKHTLTGKSLNDPEKAKTSRKKKEFGRMQFQQVKENKKKKPSQEELYTGENSEVESENNKNQQNQESEGKEYVEDKQLSDQDYNQDQLQAEEQNYQSNDEGDKSNKDLEDNNQDNENYEENEYNEDDDGDNEENGDFEDNQNNKSNNENQNEMES